MVMTVFQYTASMRRRDILDQRTRKPIRTKFEPIRRRHRLQDDVDGADDGLPVHRSDSPILDS